VFFLYVSYVKCSATKCHRKCHHKFLRNIVPNITGIHELIKKDRSTGALLDKKPDEKHHVLTKEKLRETDATLEHIPQKSLRRFAKETGISNISAAIAMKLLKLWPHKVTVVHALPRLAGLISATGFCCQFLTVKLTHVSSQNTVFSQK
jgi:oligoribonuclease NrnB/cAMP/cGMP phosphodiesterase (DHH superfamily)